MNWFICPVLLYLLVDRWELTLETKVVTISIEV